MYALKSVNVGGEELVDIIDKVIYHRLFCFKFSFFIMLTITEF